MIVKKNKVQSQINDGARTTDMLRAEGKEVITFDVCFNYAERSVSFTPKEIMLRRQYESNPQIIDRRKINETLNGNDKLLIENVFCSGGSSVIIENPEGVQYILACYRDAKAPQLPNTLDWLGGIIDTSDPIGSSIRESVEEVIIVHGGSAVIPQFSRAPWSDYNNMIIKNISALPREFGITNMHLSYGKMIPIRDPLYLDGRKDMPIGVAFTEHVNVLHGPLAAIEVLIPPSIIKQDSIESFRETLGIETKGVAPERDVVLIKITKTHPELPDVIIYNKGERIREYPTFDQYATEKFNGELRASPGLAAAFYYVGLESHPVSMARPTLTLPKLRI